MCGLTAVGRVFDEAVSNSFCALYIIELRKKNIYAKGMKKCVSNNRKKRIFLILRFHLVPGVLIRVVYQLLLDLYELKNPFHLHQDHE
jgi:hypothetical protein